MRYLCSLAILVLGMGGQAHAGWPTTTWVIVEEEGKGEPQGERALIAKKMLDHGSVWFPSMSFNAPKQVRELKVFGRRYVARLKQNVTDEVSSHGSTAFFGNMYLSSYPGFMDPKKNEVDRLLQAAFIHELFHGCLACWRRVVAI